MIAHLPKLTELGLWSLLGRDAANILLDCGDESGLSRAGAKPRARRLRRLEYAPVFSVYVDDAAAAIAVAIGATVETFVMRLSDRADPVTTLEHAGEVAHEVAKLRSEGALRLFVIEDREDPTDGRLEELEPELAALDIYMEINSRDPAPGPGRCVRVALVDIGRRELAWSFG